ncbi:helix-turn-helix domain-containing protein [Aestuariibaculum sediminum]|uniref:Helix-turn-helix transcriptional regulator n=1 Tax=Aestuariibaculum sediminum TaxID=2770637 RepID=A0A8J6UEH9_9FLAO|nr:helix-turn-helix transcriptional regulator [Aestuariibaculum sediminum]MBD0830761.1 helix-turn-helix transcriptional regulator [Aestuariibaculum sediminum]
MNLNEIKGLYKEVFKTYDHPSLADHVQKIVELDTYLPYSSTFYCITNTSDLTFEYVSRNMPACLGLDKSLFEKQGMRYFWSRMHPDDVEPWLQALNSLMTFTLNEIDVCDRSKVNYTWNYRLKNGEGKYVNIVQNTTPIHFDETDKPIIGLAHYTVLAPEIQMNVCGTAKVLNDNNEYETVYFNNFSQKLLNDNVSNRERDVIRLLVLNYTSKKIAEKLNISSNTVDTHRRNILKKFNVSSTGELIGIIKMSNNLV